MGHRYSAGTLTSAAPNLGTAFAELRNTAAREVQIYEIGVTIGAPTATNVALVRTTALGAGGANVVTGQPLDLGQPAAAATLQSNNWTTAPTFGTNYLRRGHIQANVGAGVVWVWPDHCPLVVPVSASIVLLTPVIAGAATISTYMEWSES